MEFRIIFHLQDLSEGWLFVVLTEDEVWEEAEEIVLGLIGNYFTEPKEVLKDGQRRAFIFWNLLKLCDFF
jgi:hypothetical protein